MIKLHNINKYYFKNKSNEIHVLNNISLELPNTGLISFLGESGSGKTTLLNVIGGIDKASGTIQYDENSFDKYRMKKVDVLRSQNIGYVFQNYNLILEETVYNNLSIALNMIGIYDSSEIEKRVEYCLKAVGMYKYRKKQAFALSGGQQQRVSIARALVKKSKIIIADEPTGNLDKENTIEVMNILKKISESTLVLLVTHNNEIANFYSDKIIRIKDGTILDTYKNDGTTLLSTDSDKKIYLKDLNLNEENTDFGQIKYYYDSEDLNINLKFIYKNGNIYIDSDKPIKLASDNGIELLDENYHNVNIESLNLNYDNSFFNNSIAKRNIFKTLFEYLKQGFNTLRFTTKKTKAVFISMFIMGLLFSLCSIGFTNFIYVDESTIYGDKDYYQFYSAYEFSSVANKNKVISSVRRGEVYNITMPIYTSIQMDYNVNYAENIEYDALTYVIDYKEDSSHKIISGHAPIDGEVLLSKRHADLIIKKYSYAIKSYDDLVGVDVGNLIVKLNKNFKISGVIDIDSNLVYLSELEYMRLFTSEGNFLDKEDTYNFRSYSIENKYNTYNIIYGRDLNSNDLKTNNILISTSYSDNPQSLIGSDINIDEIGTFNIVGVYESDIFSYEQDFIINNDSHIIKTIGSSYYKYANFKLLDGKEPTTYNEMIASIYSGYSIGDTVTDNYGYKRTVVGLYTGDSSVASVSYLEGRDYFVMKNCYEPNIWFSVVDMNEYEENNNTKFIKIVNSYQAQVLAIRAEKMDMLITFAIFSVILIIILAIFIYFFMRSRMLNDIYTIGVYRCLGASCRSIRAKYLCSIFVLTTFTSLLGYVVSLLIYKSIADAMHNMYGFYAIRTSLWISFVGAAILYSFNLLFGILPINLLLRNTPAEINSKYDI